MSAALSGSETSDDLLERITSGLAIDPHITAKFELAVKEYNIAVCRLVGVQLRERLPLELRYMVYEYLCPGEVPLCAKRWCRGGLLHVHDHDIPEDSEFENDDATDDSYDSESSTNGRDDVDSDDDHYEDDESNSSLHPYIPLSPRTQRDPICSQHYWRDTVIGVDTAYELAKISTRHRHSTSRLLA